MFSVYRDQTATAALRQTLESADESLRQAILHALDGLDRQLQTAPDELGESRPDGTRVLFLAPLGVLFRVDEARKLVHILRAWAYRRAA
jgi:hypothetical protein